MSKSAIYLLNNSEQEVADGSLIPLGTVIRRFGCNVRQDGNSVNLCDNCHGYYKVDIVANIETSAGGNYTVSLLKDGVEVLGGKTSIAPTPATTILPFPISVIVRNACDSSNLSVRVTGGNAKILNMTTTVVKL